MILSEFCFPLLIILLDLVPERINRMLRRHRSAADGNRQDRRQNPGETHTEQRQGPHEHSEGELLIDFVM